MLFSLLVSMFSAANSGSQLDFTCATFPATTIMAASTSDSGETLRFTLMHNFGVDYAPLHNGSLAISDLESLAQKAKIIKGLGDQFTLDFATKDCTLYGPELIACYSNEKKKIGSVEIKGASLVTQKVNTTVFDSVYQANEVILSLSVGNTSMDIPMVYHKPNCQFHQ